MKQGQQEVPPPQPTAEPAIVPEECPEGPVGSFCTITTGNTPNPRTSFSVQVEHG